MQYKNLGDEVKKVNPTNRGVVNAEIRLEEQHGGAGFVKTLGLHFGKVAEY